MNEQAMNHEQAMKAANAVMNVIEGRHQRLTSDELAAAILGAVNPPPTPTRGEVVAAAMIRSDDGDLHFIYPKGHGQVMRQNSPVHERVTYARKYVAKAIDAERDAAIEACAVKAITYLESIGAHKKYVEGIGEEVRTVKTGGPR